MSVSFGHSINQCPIATAEKAANEKCDDNQPTLAMDRALMKEVELTKDPSSSHTVRASHNSSYRRAYLRTLLGRRCKLPIQTLSMESDVDLVAKELRAL